MNDVLVKVAIGVSVGSMVLAFGLLCYTVYLVVRDTRK